MKGKRGGGDRIRRLGATEMCNEKRRRGQPWAVEPGLSSIHKSCSLGRLADRVWIGRGVVAGPQDAGGGWGSASLLQIHKTALDPCYAESRSWLGLGKRTDQKEGK